MKDWWKIPFGVVCGLLGVGVILLVSSQPRGQPITLVPPPTPIPIVVHITGAVIHPGVYTLPPGSRVQDAIQAAGGASQDADLEAVNLAGFLEDGSRLSIPRIQPIPPTEEVPPTPGSSRGGNEAPLFPSSDNPININTANQAELESLPGIGPVYAQRIIAYREANGPFTTIEDIIKVSGIGQSTFELIMELITVE
jgi:competence protein ComEA